MVMSKAVLQAPRLSRLFAPQQHRPLLSPKQSDSQSVSSPLASHSLEHDQSTDFLLRTPPKDHAALSAPFFFDVRDEADTDERLDPASDSARREDMAERSYDFSLVAPDIDVDIDFALDFADTIKLSSSGREEAPVEDLSGPSKAVISSAIAEHEPVEKESAVPDENEDEIETKDAVSVPFVVQDFIRSASPTSPTTPATKSINARPSLTIITNPEEYLSDDSGSKPLSNCKPVSVRSHNTEASCQEPLQEETHLSDMTSSDDEPLSLELDHDEADGDKENGEDDTTCLLSEKRLSKSSSADGLEETVEKPAKEIESVASTLSRLRMLKLQGSKDSRQSSKDSRQSTPSERYETLLSKIGSERKRVDMKHAKLRLITKSSESDEQPHVDENSLAAKTKEKSIAKDPVLVFEPPRAQVQSSSLRSASPEKGYEQLVSPGNESVPSSVPEWARAGYLQRNRQKRLNRLRKANAAKTQQEVPDDVSLGVNQPLVSMMASCEG